MYKLKTVIALRDSCRGQTPSILKVTGHRVDCFHPFIHFHESLTGKSRHRQGAATPYFDLLRALTASIGPWISNFGYPPRQTIGFSTKPLRSAVQCYCAGRVAPSIRIRVLKVPSLGHVTAPCTWIELPCAHTHNEQVTRRIVLLFTLFINDITK